MIPEILKALSLTMISVC